MFQRYLEVIDWVPANLKGPLIQAVWSGLSEEVRDLRDSSDQEWAQEGATHLYSAIQQLLHQLLVRRGERNEGRQLREQ